MWRATVVVFAMLGACSRHEAAPAPSSQESGTPSLTECAEKMSNIRLGGANAAAYSNERLIALIADGSRFLGKQVTITGVLSVEFEDERLYLSREHYLHLITDNSIRVDLPKLDDKLARCLQGQYVNIYGTIARDEASAGTGSVIMMDLRRIAVAGTAARGH